MADETCPKRVLFLCTGNYYRSRFAEDYFVAICQRKHLHWEVSSRGLELHPRNEGPISPHATAELLRLGLTLEEPRFPLPCRESDLMCADRVIALKESEHRPRLQAQFPHWESKVEYWTFHDIDVATPASVLPLLRLRLEELADEIAAEEPRTT